MKIDLDMESHRPLDTTHEYRGRCLGYGKSDSEDLQRLKEKGACMYNVRRDHRGTKPITVFLGR